MSDPRIDPSPGMMWRLAEADRVERAQAARQARERGEERAKRAQEHDDYLYRFLWEELRRARLEGRAGVDPGDPATFVTTAAERIARAERIQDNQARALERQALKDAELIHDIGPAYANEVAPGDGDAGGGVVGQVAPPPAVSASRRATPLGARIRRAFTRWRPDDTDDTEPDDEYPEITRHVEQYRQ
jgi:hypothetical protein